MKKLIIGLMSAMLAMSAMATTTETWTNALGQVITVTLSGETEYPAYDTYDLEESVPLTVTSNTQSNKVLAKVVLVTPTLNPSTNVAFAMPYPTGKEFTIMNVGTSAVYLATSTTFDVGATNVMLDTGDSMQFYAVSTQLVYAVNERHN